MVATMTIYPHALNVESHASVLRSFGQWAPTPGEKHTVKYRRLDTEHLEIEYAYTVATPDPVMRWTHVFDYEDLSVYRVTDIRQGPVSVNNGLTTAVISLELDALASWYASTANPTHVMNGRWSRLPMQAVVEPFQVRPAQMARSRILASLPEIEHNTHVGDRIAFVKITVNLLGVLTHLCAFCSVENTDQYLDGGLCASNNVSYIYPSLKAIMNDLPLMLGVTSADIYDVSVSEDCPVSYTFSAEAGYAGRDIIVIDGASAVLRNFSIGWNTYHVMFSDIHDMIMDWQEKTVLLQLDSNEVVMGQVQLIGSDNTVVTTIDTRYFAYNSVSGKWELTLIYRLKVDIGSMYAELQLPDGNVLRFTEGRLPWVGLAWADYVATQRNYDRTIAVVEKNKAQTEMAAGITTSLANGVFTSVFSGGAGAGTAVLGAVGNIANYYEGERARKNELAAKEGLMKSTPGTLYSPEYGVTYLNLMFNSEPMRQICLAMPIDVSGTDFTDYTKHHGYPVTDVPLTISKAQLTTASEGFLQGELTGTDNPIMIYGERRRILERQLHTGMHFKVIT